MIANSRAILQPKASKITRRHALLFVECDQNQILYATTTISVSEDRQEKHKRHIQNTNTKGSNYPTQAIGRCTERWVIGMAIVPMRLLRF